MMTASWAIVAAATMLSGSAVPQQQMFFNPAPVLCFPIDLMRNSLTQRFHESLVISGFTNVNQVFELHASPDMATWTAILILPQHIACTIASGENLQLPRHGLKGKPA